MRASAKSLIIEDARVKKLPADSRLPENRCQCWTVSFSLQVRLYSYAEGVQKQLLFRAFSSPARCCQWTPDGRTLLVGFADGVLRVLARTPDAWRLVQVVKPHTVSFFASPLGHFTGLQTFATSVRFSIPIGHIDQERNLFCVIQQSSF